MLASLPPFRSPDDEASFLRSVRASRHLAEHLADAPAIVGVLVPAGLDLTLHDDEGPLDIGHVCASVYPAVQNLLVAARAFGIGGTLTTVARVLHDELRAAVGIPDRYELAALVPLGRPKGSFSVPRRRPVEAVTHWNGGASKRERDPYLRSNARRKLRTAPAKMLGSMSGALDTTRRLVHRRTSAPNRSRSSSRARLAPTQKWVP